MYAPIPRPADTPRTREWIDQTFDVPAVRNGGLFRLTVKAVEDSIGMDRFIAEIGQRRFRALENAGHIVVFCNTKSVAILNERALGSAPKSP